MSMYYVSKLIYLWVLRKFIILVSWGLYQFSFMYYIKANEHCHDFLFTLAFINLVNFFALDLLTTALFFTIYNKGIMINSPEIKPYFTFYKMMACGTTVLMAIAIIAAWVFEGAFASVKIGSWYIFSNSSFQYTMTIIGLAWLVIHHFMAFIVEKDLRKITNYIIKLWCNECCNQIIAANEAPNAFTIVRARKESNHSTTYIV